MKLLKLTTLVLLFIALPLTAFAPEKKAKTIDELAKMYDSSNCKVCHAQIYAQWEKSQHARPLLGDVGEGLFLTPLAKKGATPFSPDDPKKATMKNYPCLKCHLPQALTSAEDSVAVELTEALLAEDRAKISKLQITCIVCHNEKAIIHRLQEGKPKKGVLYSTKDMPAHPDKTFTKIKRSSIMKEAVFCGQCHGLGPNFDAENPYQCATLYGSYLHSYIPAGGTQTCQDCHMKDVAGKADHLMGLNWIDPKATSDRLSRSISLDVQTVGYSWLRKKGDLRSKVMVDAKVTSSAGHRIPDG